MMNVLVIVRDRGIQRLLVRSLKEKHRVRTTIHDSAIEAIEQEQPEILITEYPDLCMLIRQYWSHLLLIVLLESSQKHQISHILDEGADDCLAIPFSFAELEARMHAHIRRVRSGAVLLEPDLDFFCSNDGYISMCISRRKVSIGGQHTSLTKIEFELLRELMVHAGRVLTYRYLLQKIWGETYVGEDDYVRTYIHRLRGKIEPNPSSPLYILTEMGVGYVFRSPSLMKSHAQQHAYAIP
jgi:two-component system KDP operon response regulator KdpE